MNTENEGLHPLSVVVFAILLLLFAGIQSNFSGMVAGYTGGQPDFVLVLLLCAALLSDAGSGCLIGLCGGLVTASIVGETVGSLLVSRIVAGFVAGQFANKFFRTNALVILLVVTVGSVVAEFVYGLCAPPLRGVSLTRYLHTVGVTVLWNATLALPIAFLLRKAGWGEGRR